MAARDETPHQIIKKLGKKKCNGSWDASVENLTIQQVIELSEARKEVLTGASQKARSLEIMGTCVAMRVSVEGMRPKAAIAAVKNGEFDDQFS